MHLYFAQKPTKKLDSRLIVYLVINIHSNTPGDNNNNSSVRTDNRYVSVSADISVIGFADMENLYRYRLSVSADMNAHIGGLTDIL